MVKITTGGGVIFQSTDRTGLDPELEPLADNAFSFAPTHALRNTNTDKGPAIDAGNTTLTVDQRGFSREVDIFNAPDPPDSDNINDDIGAFEAQANPTAASVTISGRVMMSPFGKGIARAQVSITDANGQTRATRTNFFGYYRFESVDAGETYIFNISSKFYSFSPQVITINEELADLNFIAEP